MRKLSIEYLIATFAIMAVCWGSCMLCSLGGIYLSEVPLLYIPYLLGGLSPTVASYLVLRKNGNIQNLRQWLAITFDFRHNIYSYLLVAVFSACFFFCLCSISGYESGAPLFALVFMIPMMLLGGGLEEAGWRGILQPELEKAWGHTAATIVVCVIWWLWHLPLFYIGGVSQYGADFIDFGINVLGLSFALSAIKKVTGSTWLCVLFHCSINALHGVYLVSESSVGSAAAAAVLVLLSYVVLGIQKKKQIFA